MMVCLGRCSDSQATVKGENGRFRDAKAAKARVSMIKTCAPHMSATAQAPTKGLWRGAGERFLLGSGQSQLLEQITTTAFIFRPQWLRQPSSAFFGLLRAFHAATLHHTAKRRLDHIQQPTGWLPPSIAAWAAPNGRDSMAGSS